MRLPSAILATFLLASPAAADISVKLLPPWTGKSVPTGQQCPLNGGKGATPPMEGSGIPAGTAWLLVEFDDKSYGPLSKNGGHGTLLYPVKGATTRLPAVPGMTDRLPGGVRVHKASRGSGKYRSDGYLPPCSGGQGNTYTATVYPIGQDGKPGKGVQITTGRY